jgi:hypothetical protein
MISGPSYMGEMTSMVVHLFIHKQSFSRANLGHGPTQQKEKYYHRFLYSLGNMPVCFHGLKFIKYFDESSDPKASHSASIIGSIMQTRPTKLLMW